MQKSLVNLKIWEENIDRNKFVLELPLTEATLNGVRVVFFESLQTNMSAKSLTFKIETKKAVIGIVGVGYVGEALAEGITASNFRVIGFEIDHRRIAFLKQRHFPNFLITSDKRLLKKCHLIFICIPTPLSIDKKPDTSLIQKASTEISRYLKKEQLVIVESSVAPGTTRILLKPLLEKSGLIAGIDFYLAYSPERVDPGNSQYNLNNIPKVVSGLNNLSRDLAVLFYSKVVSKVVPVSSLETAELTKVTENVFRLVNISLVNELNDYAKKISVNMWEVVNAAASKPFGFLPHFPGPGAGGYCIPVLPHYLTESALALGLNLPIVEEAIKRNDLQSEKVVESAVKIIHSKTGNGTYKAKALLIGISYKADIDDTRESVALKIWEKLEKLGVKVFYHDPYVEKYNGINSLDLNEKNLSLMDLIIIITDHKNIPYEMLTKSAIPLLDTRNVLANHSSANINYI